MLLHNPSVFGERIRHLRRARGYSQAILARRAQCSRKTIISIEAGENVALYTVFKVLCALGMTLEIVDNRLDLQALADLVERDD